MILQNVKKSLLFFVASGIVVLTSCSSGGPERPEVPDFNNVKKTSDDANSGDLINTIDSQNSDGAIQLEGDSQTPSVNINADGGDQAGVMLNPPHGEPGHDCAIPVGSPLPAAGDNSQGVNNNTQTARINPPHGEPGHDCAIPVGDPLP